MNYATATQSLTLLNRCSDKQLQRLRDKSDAYIARSGDGLDVKVNKTIHHICRERGI